MFLESTILGITRLVWRKRRALLCVVCLGDDTAGTAPYPGTGLFLLTCRFMWGFSLNGLIQQGAQSFLKEWCLCCVNLPDLCFTLVAAFMGNHSPWEQGWGNELLSYCLLSFCFFPPLLWHWIHLTVHVGHITKAVSRLEVLQSYHTFSPKRLWNDMEVFHQLAQH